MNDSQHFRRVCPLVAGGTPCRPFIACGRPNQERSSLLVLTVLLLLIGGHLEEGEGVKNERDGISEGGIPQRSFFEVSGSPKSLWVEVWVENLRDFTRKSSTVSGRPIRTPKSANTLSVFG